MNKTCGNCDKTDGMCYTSNPPQLRCKVTGEYHTYDHECDVEENMGKQDKPRICEMLGVEEDEVWEYPDLPGEFRIHNGIRQYFSTGDNEWYACANERALLEIINHPDRIIRARFTEKEIARAKNLLEIIGAGTISRPGTGGTFLIADEKTIALRDDSFFSICPGQSVKLSEICGGEG